MKFWNFSSTLGRPNAEEKERKRRIREAQLQQIQRELTLDRRLITNHWKQPPQRAKTFRSNQTQNTDESNLKFRSKSTHKLDEESQFVSRLRFLDVNENHLDSENRNSDFKRHSTSFCTPDDDQRLETGFYGMRRRYTTAFDSEDTDFTGSTSKSANIVTFASPSSSSEERNSINREPSRNRNFEQRLRFSDQLHSNMSTSGTNRSSHTSFGDRDNRSDHEEDDGFGEYRSALHL